MCSSSIIQCTVTLVLMYTISCTERVIKKQSGGDSCNYSIYKFQVPAKLKIVSYKMHNFTGHLRAGQLVSSIEMFHIIIIIEGKEDYCIRLHIN